MLKDLEVVVEDASYLAAEDQKAFAMIRRVGFGASDSSILLGVNPFPDGKIEKLIAQKKSETITANERAIGKLVNVRKGADLEPLILEKFQKRYGLADSFIKKPKAMYRIPGTPLTVNFDGVMKMGDFQVPVECKFVSTAGERYWSIGRALGDHLLTGNGYEKEIDEPDLQKYITKKALQSGMPSYYYTQVQQQILALKAPVGYLTAIFDKTWELRTFIVEEDERIQEELLKRAKQYWAEVKAD